MGGEEEREEVGPAWPVCSSLQGSHTWAPDFPPSSSMEQPLLHRSSPEESITRKGGCGEPLRWSPDTSVESSVSTRQLQMVDLPASCDFWRRTGDQGPAPSPRALAFQPARRFGQPRACIAHHQLYLSRCILTESGSWHVWAFPKGARGWVDGTEDPHALVTLT